MLVPLDGLLGPRELAPFFRRLPKADVVFVDRLLKGLRGELHAAEWEYQAEDALTFLGALPVGKRSFDVFESRLERWDCATGSGVPRWPNLR